MSKTGSKNSRGNSIVNSAKLSFAGSFADENQAQNHTCLWRKSYEEEHQKRIEAENSVIKYLKVHTDNECFKIIQKLEQEKDFRFELEREIAILREQVDALEQRNFMLENEIRGRVSEAKRITCKSFIKQNISLIVVDGGLSSILDEGSITTIINAQSPEIQLRKDLSRSPNRPIQMIKPAKLQGEDFGAPKVNRNQRLTSQSSQQNQLQKQKKSDINFQQANSMRASKELQKQHQLILNSQDTSQQIQRSSARPSEEPRPSDFITQSTRESAFSGGHPQNYRESNQIKPKPSISSQMTQNDNQSQNKIRQQRTQRMKTSESIQKDLQLNKQISHGLSIDYRDNDPNMFYPETQLNTQSNRNGNNGNRKLSGIRKYRSGDNFDFVGLQQQQTYENIQNQVRFEEQSSLLNQQNTMINNQNPPFYFNQEKEQIKQILKHYKKQNLGFSKFKIISIDGEGKLERIKLKVDPIRIAQREFFYNLKKSRQKNRKEQQVAKSMQFSQDLLQRPQLHQLQPSQMLRQDYDPKYQNLKLQNHDDFDEEGGVIIENEEDVLDCQEGNKTPFNHYSLSGKRNQIQFQSNEYNATMGGYQSPIRDLRQQLYLDDEELVQTHRALGNGINEQDFEDQMLLETPVHRLGANNSGYDPTLNGLEKSSEYDTFRAKQKCEYSNDQIKEMQMSIRNISTNKKQSRKQPGKVNPGNKLDKKNLESFRAIKEEETHSLNLSGDEGYNDQVESIEIKGADKSNSFGWGVGGAANTNIGEHFGMIKNPTYTRITHASKQMEKGLPGGPFRLGATMGFRNEGVGSMNPLMKSMPNMDFLREKDKSQTLPFDDLSGINEDKGNGGVNAQLQHSSTFYDINNSSYINPIDGSKLKAFSSPQNYKQSGINPVLTGPAVTDSPQPQTKHHRSSRIFEEFFIIGTDKNDLNTLEWGRSDHQFVAPKTLYMYTSNGKVAVDEECERRRVVKDFCFPDGIEVKMLKNSGDTKSMIASKAQKILYSQKSVREQCFVFIMNANDDSISENSMMQQSQQLETFPGGSTQDKYYNCLCVVFNELISPPSNTRFNGLKVKELEKKFRDTKVYSTKKAYCFMFVNQYYQLHLDVINLLINALKFERLKISQELQSYDLNLTDQTYTDILSMLDLPLLSHDMTDILDKFYYMDIEDQLRFGKNIQLDIGNEIGCIKYDLPSITDYSFMDNIWFCPTLFSLFSVDNMLKLLSAVMLEKSLVFIGKQGLLSSSILGFNSLLYPFKWCLALVPILPHPLIEMIEAPLPILVGITKREYREINLTKQERDSKIWVFLETGEITWNKDGMKVPRFGFSNIDEINYEYLNFKKAFEVCYTSTSGIDSDRSSSVSADLENYQIYNDEVKYNCRRICEIIRKSIKTYILDSLKQSKLQRRGTNHTTRVENFVLEMGEIVVEKGRQEDKAFLQQFVETQMFATYIEENLK